ncbi:MAG: prolyl oligopeptidase family serine peptidase [Fimbriimonadaceae bacterium]|nr:prolyl oligopeptidase family serine peptidase [Fimbriimonadaceae bacterium]
MMQRTATRRSMWIGLSFLLVVPGLTQTPPAAKDPNDEILAKEAYAEPAAEIKNLVLAQWHLNESFANVGPDRRTVLLTRSAGMATIAEYARPYVRLGGLAIDVDANRARTLSLGGSVSADLYDLETGKRTAIQAPKDARLSGFQWSPDGKSLAFLVHEPNESHLYVADVATGRSRRLSRRPLLLTHVTSVDWTGDGKHVVALLVPAKRTPRPVEPPVPAEPNVRLTTRNPARLRTFPSLLEGPYHAALYEYLITGQLTALDAKTGEETPVGKPTMIRGFDVGPNAKFVRVTTVRKPFSYLVPVSSFGSAEEIWNEKGEPVAEISRRALQLGSADPTPDDPWGDAFDADEQARRPSGGQGGPGAETGPPRKRNLAWRPDGKGISFLLLEPANRDNPSAKRKDRVMRWFEPYGDKDVETIYESENAITGVQYAADAKTLFVNESVAAEQRTYAVDLGPGTRRLVSKSRATEFYRNPGSLVTTTGPMGGSVVLRDSQGNVYLSGTQYAEDPMAEAPRPFVDRVKLASATDESQAESERMFYSSPDRFERLIAFLDVDLKRTLVARESSSETTQHFLSDAGKETQLTKNRDYAADVTALRNERFRVTRADGFKFWVEATLPRGFDGSSKPPAFFWFYPSEFVDQKTYDERGRTYNKNAFRPISRLNKAFLALLGYTVVEPDCPIIGPADRKNDKYVADLRSNLYATINALEARGFADRDRLAIGGHSYGAFSTANALVHTPFFRAGIAGDGAYNRLLTPAGFQSETRTLWEAREVYTTLSPLLWAEQVTGALLMYHGADDQNVGTFPINSDRMFQALNTLGKTAALYVYPYEDHGPATRETLLDLWARWIAWLEKHVKSPEIGK